MPLREKTERPKTEGEILNNYSILKPSCRCSETLSPE